MSLKLIAALSTACALFAAAAMATPVTVTLSSAYPAGYYFYNYTATDGSSQSQPVAPYPVTVSETGVYSNQSAFAFCFDINNPSYVGQTYTGQLVTRTDQASMEATYLENELNAAGLISASTTLKGAISMAIWAIMFPSSTKTDGSTFAADPAASYYEAQASQAVTSGAWTTADSATYPIFIPDDATAQRFGLILPGAEVVSMSSQTGTPEPGTLSLLFAGAALLAGVMSRNLLSRK